MTKMDSMELYYAEMESARNEAMDAYFAARPQLMRTLAEQSIFRAGFERAFNLLWNQRPVETSRNQADATPSGVVDLAPEPGGSLLNTPGNSPDEPSGNHHPLCKSNWGDRCNCNEGSNHG